MATLVHLDSSIKDVEDRFEVSFERKNLSKPAVTKTIDKYSEQEDKFSATFATHSINNTHRDSEFEILNTTTQFTKVLASDELIIGASLEPNATQAAELSTSTTTTPTPRMMTTTPVTETMLKTSTFETARHKTMAVFKCPRDTGLFPHPEACEQFWHCSSSIPYLKRCPRGLVFSPENSVCDYTSSSCPDRRLRKNPRGFICLRNGIHAAKHDCRSFYLCYNGLAYKLKCPKDLFFSPVSLTCERSALVCILRR